MFLKNLLTIFQIPTPLALGISRFWTEILLPKFEFAFSAVFSVRFCGFQIVQFLTVSGFYGFAVSNRSDYVFCGTIYF